ncbi:hypothetical protein JTE90_001799 [Oedothorax gibbosus]|uniref:Rho GTPase-activating protein 32 n=1 Tax=Oedothorax gibbosus TaxID=931172 RepID=A0AAV6VR78_9ARAC|nr:hypothetical protein JTE90_001799 [Oedothorax gibbosus]
MAPPTVKIKHITRSPSSSGDTRFPKLDECAHFHYENVELGPIKVLLCEKQSDPCKSVLCSASANKENETDHLCFLVTVISNSKKWVVRRSYKNFVFLDTQLHRCVYDRKYSLLRELLNLVHNEPKEENFEENIRILLSEYLERFSQLAGSLINCGPVLNWFELDNRGNRLIVTDEVAINTPAVAAAYVVVPYSAQATDEISFDVGDMISVIDMPPPEESSWWRGKKGFEVGFFPSECVEVIGDKVPNSFKLSNSSTKPVFRRHGKLIAFFRSFLLSRPSRRKLKQSGILKERVFGCDLGEHLLNTGREIPMVLKCCSEFIEEYGIVDGIYRLSGVSSNIQRLRLAFDEDRPLNLGDPATVHDIHSVASLLKMYFRELPNPLLTYQLYDKFVNAVQSVEDIRLLRVRDVVQQLPPPHFRTLQYLLSHLARVAAHGEQTGMTPKNIAIVWAPNLLRSRDVENGGVGALHVVGVQAVLTEYLIRFADLIFDEKVPFLSGSEQEGLLRARPKSLAISTPTKLLSLEEARARVLSTHLPPSQQKYIEVGGGPDKLPSKYHTVIDLPSGKQSLPKLKKSPSGWKSFFSRGWYSGSTRDKSRSSFRSARKASTGSLPHHSAYMPEEPSTEPNAPHGHRKKLRTVKSAESLAHCLKESPDILNKEDNYDKNIHKTSPQASTDSSHSFEASSPLTKSPSQLQKHTRSSSHESYFDGNGMDVISEPSFEEDEHGLFYYVSEQMRMLQDESAKWDRKNEDAMSTRSLDQGKEMQANPMRSRTNLFENGRWCDDAVVDTGARKQKLSASSDFSQVKFQKLNEDEETLDSLPPDESAMHCPSNEVFGLLPPNVDDKCSIWEQSDDLMLDPFQLYEAVVNKRCSPLSSSDAENDPNNRTVVERYGNAETVLVEVHATQGSSSSEEDHFSPGVRDSERDEVFFPPDDVKRPVNKAMDVPECSSSPVEVQDCRLDFSDEECEPYQDLGFDPVSYTVSETRDNVLPSAVEDSCTVNVKSENAESQLAKEIETVQTQSDTIADKPSDIKTVDSSFIDRPSTKPVDGINSVVDVPQDLKSAKKPCDLKLDVSPSEASNLDDTDPNLSFSINSPPSPVYPPKSLKTQEFQPLRTKIDKLPLHKKKQIVIPSPSSPVEEVRKKFELQASTSRKTAESPTSEIKYRSHVKDLTPKLVKAFETVEVAQESVVSKPDSVLSTKSESLASKRHSEPPPKTASSNASSDMVKRISNKYESGCAKATRNTSSEKLNTKPKTSPQPSLFTQLKIRKLQSLQAEGSAVSEPVDPWSDPILDMQEDYHPITAYLPSPTSVKDVELETGVSEDKPEDISFDNVFPTEQQVKKDSVDCPVISVKEVKESPAEEIVARKKSESQEVKPEASDESHQSNSKLSESSPESEAVKRERINRIKEERRAQLREKLKQESFRMEAEEKEKVQTKFRLRKDCSKHSLSFDSPEENKKSDKAVETDSAKTTETGTTCDVSVSESNKSQTSDPNKSNISEQESKAAPQISGDFVFLQNKSNSGKKSLRSSYDDSRKWMPPTDIRDKVAMFERSKDADLCRLGPNGKFPQKQSTSALASSFVR